MKATRKESVMLLRALCHQARRTAPMRCCPTRAFATQQEPREANLHGRYAGKVVVVTGGSRGIGEGCVRAFSEAGATVVFCGLKDHAEAGRALTDRCVRERACVLVDFVCVFFVCCVCGVDLQCGDRRASCCRFASAGCCSTFY